MQVGQPMGYVFIILRGVLLYGCVQKLGENPKMDGENNGSKPY